MNPVLMLEQKRQQFHAALQQVLPQWQRTDFDRQNLFCWACQSRDIKPHPGRLGRRVYRCCSCQTLFYEPSDPRCDCPEPGKSPKCSQCPNYQQLMQMVSAQIKAQQ
ncbi:MAG TPA: hypothetical protein V6D29_00325 [Leptolyngbyaceae cyanobacterium]